jgi:predicted peptidase
MQKVRVRKMKKLLIIVAAAVACAFVSNGAEAKAAVKAKVSKFNIVERTEAKEFIGKDGKVFRYRIAEKASPDGSKIPLVIFLHGAGERGTNNQAQLVHGVGDLVRWMDQHEKGYRLIAGQVPFGKRWVEVNWGAKSHTMPENPSETMALLLEMLDAQLSDPAVDLKRIYVTGISMGGYGTWDLISRRPDVFAAALPICGGGDVAQAAKIAKIPLWTFHGSADGAVPVCRSRNMVSSLWANGSNAHYREYPDAGHAVWVETYKDKRVLSWFFKQKKK